VGGGVRKPLLAQEYVWLFWEYVGLICGPVTRSNGSLRSLWQMGLILRRTLAKVTLQHTVQN